MNTDRSMRRYPNSCRRGFKHSRMWTVWTLIIVLTFGPLATPIALAESITMKNGCQYQGALGALSAIGQSPFDSPSGTDANKVVVFVDDGLRRTYVPRNQLALNPAPFNPIYERIKVEQRVANGTRSVGEVGQMMHVSRFTDYGRRYVVINSARGPIEIHQGITEITPHYCEVEGLSANRNSYRWRQSVATSSIPREILSKIIYRQIDPTNPNERLRVVTLYQQAERHKDAVAELESIAADFPDMKDLTRLINSLRSAYARRILREIQLRYDSGQYDLALGMMQDFPTENIASEILGEVGTLGQNHDDQIQTVESIIVLFDEQVEEAKKAIELDDDQKKQLEQIQGEIQSDLNLNNLLRLADFNRLVDDATKSPDQKVALAITGWLLGSGSGDGNIAVALSQVRVRDLVFEYLSTADAVRRQMILEELQQLEGSQPDSLAKIIANLLPVKPVPQEFEQGIPGFFRIELPGVEANETIEYVVQLPPEYDPYRRYPCIVTLGDGMSPSEQVAWWAGGFNERNKMRMGQAARHGYIVLSPSWRLPNEVGYRYSVKEHASVLFSVQDAMKRFSIDTDRVFLSGHSQGGTAAWDIGQAHPDLWAGVIPIVASAGKYITRYWENWRHTGAYYFVHGDMDHRRMEANNTNWNRYFKRHGFDVTISEYIGRGHEHFYEDVHRIFEWAGLHERKTTVKEFETVSLRPTDNFFWWVESSDFNAQNVVLPAEWPKEGIRDGKFIVTAPIENRFTIRTPGNRVTLWFTPDLVDFSKPVDLRINQSDLGDVDVRPERIVMLEDVRLRADRQNPYWAKVDWIYGQR